MFGFSITGTTAAAFKATNMTVAFAERALEVMESLGATIVDTDTGDVFAYTDDEFTALLYEFKAQIADYLATLINGDMRTLGDLIAVSTKRIVARELVYYGQEVFESSEQYHGLSRRSHLRGGANTRYEYSAAGIDNALAADNLDAIVAPHLTNSTGPAVAGYPNLSIPVGIRDSGRPAGMLMYSTFLHEPQLIAFGYDLEQELNARSQPQFLHSVIPVPNAGLCDQPRQPQVFTGKAHLLHGKIF